MKVLATSLLLSFAAVAPASAGVVFMDDFSGYGPTSQLNAADSVFLGNWQTTGGTVDYLATGGNFGYLCPNGQNCIDLDGSTFLAGKFETVKVFGAGVYDVLFQLIGNKRDGGNDSVTVSFGSISQTISLAFNQVANQDSFGSAFKGISVTAGTTLSFQNGGGDNIGALLKNVVVQHAVVPVPAAGGLMMLALGALGALRRRKAKV